MKGFKIFVLLSLAVTITLAADKEFLESAAPINDKIDAANATIAPVEANATFTDKVKEVGSDVKDITAVHAEKVYEKLKDGAKDVLDWAGNITGKLFNVTTNITSFATDKISDGAEIAWNATKEKVINWTSSDNATADNLTGNGWNVSANESARIWNETKESISDKLNISGNASEENFTSGDKLNETEALFDENKDRISDNATEENFARFNESEGLWNETKDKISEKFNETSDNVEATRDQLADNVEQYRDRAEELSSDIKDSAEEANDKAKDSAKEGLEILEDYSEEAKAKAKKNLREPIEDINA